MDLLLFGYILCCLVYPCVISATPASFAEKASDPAVPFIYPGNTSSQNLSSSLSAPHDNFGVGLVYDDSKAPMPVLGVYLLAIKAAYRFSAFDLRKQLPQQPFTLPEYRDIGLLVYSQDAPLHVSAVQTRFALWGILSLIKHIYRDGKYTPVIASLWFYEREVGRVAVVRKISGAIAGVEANLNLQQDLFNNSVTDLGDQTSYLQSVTAFLNDQGFEVRFEMLPNAPSLPSLGIFLTALSGLVAIAEQGLDRQCGDFLGLDSNFAHQVGFRLKADEDDRGNVKLRYSHVRRAIKGTALAMVERKQFAQMTVVLTLDGERIAEGGWARPSLGPSSTE